MLYSVTPPPDRGTLAIDTPIAGVVTPSAEPPTASGPAVRAFQPPNLSGVPAHPPITDQFDRDWAWAEQWAAYRHDNGTSTVLRDPADLWGNAFEWCWAHTRATGITRRILLRLAWDYDRFPTGEDFADPRPHWPGYVNLIIDTGQDAYGEPTDTSSIEEAVLELVVLGELTLIATASNWSVTDLSQNSPQVTYDFPAYQAWCLDETQGVTYGVIL